MTLRTSGGNAKNGMTCSQAASHCRLIAGYWPSDVGVGPGVQGVAGGLLGRGRVDQAELGGDLLAVLVVAPSAATPGSGARCRSARSRRARRPRSRPGRPVRPSQTTIRTSSTPRALSSLSTRSQNLAPSVVSTQMPRTSLRPSTSTPDGQVGGLVAHRAVVADLADDRVEEDHRIDPVQRPGLPFLDLLEHRVGDLADQVRGDLDVVDLQQMRLDVAHRHARGRRGR